jgi:hypothetical protein
MRRTRSAQTRLIGIALCFAILTAGGKAVARQTVPTDEEYGPLMTEIRFTVGDADLHVDARYWPELGEDLDKLIPMFRQVEAFWSQRGTDDAVGFAQQSLVVLDDLGDATVEQNRGAARAAVDALRGTCQPCHEAYREQTEDGYRIKPGS